MKVELEPNPDDFCVWPDGTWCLRRDLAEYTWLSDDYLVIYHDTIDWRKFNERAQ